MLGTLSQYITSLQNPSSDDAMTKTPPLMTRTNILYPLLNLRNYFIDLLEEVLTFLGVHATGPECGHSS